MKKLFTTILAVLALGLGGCSQIDTGNVGVIKTGGKFNAEELQPGWHLTWFSSVFEVSTKDNAITFEDLKPKTADQITVEEMDIDVYYSMGSSKAQEVMVKLAGDLTQNEDGDYIPGVNYVSRTAREAINNAMSKVRASDAQTKRGDFINDVQTLLQKELDSKFGKDWFRVTNVNLRNLTVDKKLEQAIRDAAQVQYQIDAKTKQVELAEQEAKRLLAEARGRADAARIEAQALQGASGADYLKKMELENQRAAISKWNGVLPTTNAGGVTPFINVGK